MDEYKQHLRRLAVHDEALLDAIPTDGSPFATGVIDERTVALVHDVDAALERYDRSGWAFHPKGMRRTRVPMPRLTWKPIATGGTSCEVRVEPHSPGFCS
jgi:hypothetical protein